MNVVKLKYPGSLVDRKALIKIYAETAKAHIKLFGKVCDQDAEKKLTQRWDNAAPKEKEDFERFYLDNDLMPQELINWYQRSNYQRINRAIYAGGIAKSLGFRTFCEFGCGPGADLTALACQGFTPLWACDINRQGLKIASEILKKFVNKPIKLFNNLFEKVEDQVPADFLYSSDTFEHIFDLESTLKPWIKNFKLVIVYAPFGSNKEQHQHTSYPADRFHSFMKNNGFVRIVYNLGVPPFTYLRFDQFVKLLKQKR